MGLDQDGLMGSAYYHKEDDQLAIVMINYSDKEKPVNIPPRSIVTLVAK